MPKVLRNAKNGFSTAFLLLVLGMFAEEELKAYVDPGSGALLWQVLAAAFFGALFYLRKFSGKLFRRGKGPTV